MLKVFIDFFQHLLKGIREPGSFTQNFAIIFSGNMLAQLLGFLFTPFVARIYGPETYGVFALFMSFVTNLSPVSTLQFPSGYVAAESKDDFYRILKITFFTLLLFTGIASSILWVWQEPLLTYFNARELSPYLFWLPIYLLLMGLDNILLGWNIRIKQFKRGVVAKIVATLVSKGSAIFLGIAYTPAPSGLIISNLVTYPFEGATKLSKAIRESFSEIRPSTWQELKSTLQKFKGYALYLTPGLFIVNTSNLLPVFYFSYAFDKAAVGYYALASSIVSIPLGLVINSSLTVFLQKAAETIQTSKDQVGRMTMELYKKLFVFFYPALILLAFLCKPIFALIFGAEWEQAGIFASYLCVAATFHLVHSPLSVLFRLTHTEHINLVINIVFLGIKFLGLWVGIYFKNIEISIIGFCATSIISCFVSLWVLFGILKIAQFRLLKDLFLALIFGAVIVWYNMG